MRSTDVFALMCAAGLVIACGGNARNDQENPYVSSSEPVGTTGSDTVSHGNDGDARHFAIQASKRNAAEIELGTLALERAQSSDVMQFAQMMVNDHTEGFNKLKDAVAAHGGAVDRELPDESEELLERLKTFRGADFDREYMDAMVDAHQEMRGMVSGRLNDAKRMTTSPSGLEAAVDQWTETALPKVEAHLARAAQIRNALRGRTNDTN